jgi:hypothetical protein
MCHCFLEAVLFHIWKRSTWVTVPRNLTGNRNNKNLTYAISPQGKEWLYLDGGTGFLPVQ